MLPILVKLHIASSAMAAMNGMATPGPVMEQVVEATLVASHFTSPIAVHLYDENEHQEGTLAVWRDGTTTDTGFVAHARATARTASGCPIARATWLYVRVVPYGI